MVANIPYSGSYDYIFDNDYFWCWLRKNGNYNLVGIKYADSTQIIETDVYSNGHLKLMKTYDHMLEYGYVDSIKIGSDYADVSSNVFNTITQKNLAINGGTNPLYLKVIFADRRGLYLYPVSSSSNNFYFYLVKDPRYLATINNLSEPVVKTASKTMKITYILTQEENA